MTLTVLTAVTGPQEAPLVTALDRSAVGVRVVRRCADLADLIAAAAAGLAVAGIVSADLPGLDRAAVQELDGYGVAVVALISQDDLMLGARLRNLGVAQSVRVGAAAEDVAAAVSAAVTQLRARQTADAAGSPALIGALEAAGPFGDGADPPAGLGAPDAPLPAEPASPPGRLVAVWGPVGAPGRTTVAVTVAAELAGQGRQVLLADADTYGASVAQTLGLLDEAPGLAAAVRTANRGELSSASLARLTPVVLPGLRVLTGLAQAARWPELHPSALELVWLFARQQAHCVLVDVGFGIEADEELMFDTAAPQRHAAARSALCEADLVVAVGAGDPIGLQRLIAGLPQVRDVVGEHTPVLVVVNRARDGAVGGPADERIRSALLRYGGIEEVVVVPDDRDVLDGAMLAGRTLPEFAPHSPVRIALQQLAARVDPGSSAPEVATVNGRPRRRLHRPRTGSRTDQPQQRQVRR